MVKNQKGFSVIHGLLVLIVVGVIGFIGYSVYNHSAKKTDDLMTTSSASAPNDLTAYTVPGESTNGSPEFGVTFYKNATVQPKNGLEYLISQAADGTQSSVWVYKLKNEVPVCDSGGTSFTVQIMGSSVPACYRNDRIVYTAEISQGGIKYQVNLVSQKPIALDEAKTILSSINLK